ncbi:MAG TPA: heavy-metal-associated domain-containing protein [Devosia sp.]|nr:heavy-metal-associated domain-containing protein [Devosia sp.]
MQFHIQNMTCGGCAKSVTRAIHSVDPEASVTAYTANRRVNVVSTAEPAKLRQALSAAGYPPAS